MNADRKRAGMEFESSPVTAEPIWPSEKTPSLDRLTVLDAFARPMLCDWLSKEAHVLLKSKFYKLFQACLC